MTTVYFSGFDEKTKQEYENLSQSKFGYKINHTLDENVDYLIYKYPDQDLIDTAICLSVEYISEDIFLKLAL